MQMVQHEWPRHWNPSVSSNFEVGWIPFSQYWPFGVIRIGLSVWKWKSWKISTAKGVQRDANGPVWMSPALKTLCLIHFCGWENSIFPLLALWGNKNWPPSMKVKELETFQNKIGLKWCKWSNLNYPDTGKPLSHPLMGLDEFPLLNIYYGPLLWSNKNWPPSMKQKSWKFFIT